MNFHSISWTICLLLNLCDCQALSGPDIVEPVLDPGICVSGCLVEAVSGYRTAAARDSSHPTPEVYLVFSSYQVISSSSVNQACNTVQNVASTLSPPFSVVSEPVANTTAMYFSAQTSLTSFLGLTGCTPRNPFDITPTELLQVQNFSSIQSSTPTASPSSTPGGNTPAHPGNSQSGLRTKDRIIIGVTVPIPLVVLTILGIIAWRKTRRSKIAAAAAAMDKDLDHSEGMQPYLQQKAELEAEERRRHELETMERVYEMTGEDAVCELSTGEDRRRITALQELRGAEHSKELEAPSNL